MRTDLPTGTVTFLFTDIEGSTRLLDSLGAEGYADALAEHRRIVRASCVAEGGVEVDTQGDAFFFAFATPSGALRAANAVALGLEPGPMRLRMGVHTGEPLLTGEGYVGPDVHRAARIAAAGHGGQVLVSASTAGLVDVELTDLGEHRFKDLAAKERVFQLGEVEFPRIRSLFLTNLPVPATSFLGRERELGDVVELFRRDDLRLLTLTGPGGTGKTRLAVHAAAEAGESFPDGIWWVPLASLRDDRLLWSSVARAVSIEEEPGADLAETVLRRLEARRMLLVLDNLEHLLPDVAGHVARLRDAQGPTLVVTSRERLQLQGEHVYAVPTLAIEDGVELFLARSRALRSNVEASEHVAELCSRLDNLPLALELAAARTVVFSPEQLVNRLSERLDLLKAGRDADPRQQTLRATIEWSYDLLEREEQRLFRGLSVFAGTCTFAAADAVCGASPDTLQSLLDKSLLRRRDEDQPRFWMLETVRELATEHLRASGEEELLRRRHFEHYLEVALSANLAPDIEGPMRHGLVIPERDNMRTALTWAVENDERELGLELVVALENYWATNAPHEGLEWVVVLLEGASIDSRLMIRALRVRGGMENILMRFDESESHWRLALELARESDDELAIALMLHRLAGMFINRGEVEAVRTHAEESLAIHRRLKFGKGEAQALTSLAEVAEAEGDHEQALELHDEARRIAEDVGFLWWQAGAGARMAAILTALDREADARVAAREALRVSSSIGDRKGVYFELALLAEIEAKSGDRRLAGVIWGAAEAENERVWTGRWLHGAVVPERVLAYSDGEFELGRAQGRRLALQDAVAVALGDGDGLT